MKIIAISKYNYQLLKYRHRYVISADGEECKLAKNRFLYIRFFVYE